MNRSLSLMSWIALAVVAVAGFRSSSSSEGGSSSSLLFVSAFVVPAPPSRLLNHHHRHPPHFVATTTTATATNSRRCLVLPGFLFGVRSVAGLTRRYGFDPRRPSDSRGDGSNDDDENSSPYGDNNDNDDDIIDLSKQDWRAFRAHLVQSEASPSGVLSAVPRSPKEEEEGGAKQQVGGNSVVEAFVDDEDCVPESGDCDLDNLGAVFGLSPSSPKSMALPKGGVQVQPPQGRRLEPPPTSSSSASASRPSSSQQQQSSEPRNWAYDSGQLIETGAVLLGGVEQEFGFGLRQTYFHKAATLILDHDPRTFTKGIILNRPTDVYLHDDLNPDCKWRVWFGGDVQGLESDNPDIVCIHSLDDPKARHASIPIMNDIQWTTFDNAKRLVRSGYASPNDFWVFCGYAGWGAGQLSNELERNSWYVVATDSNTVLQQLQRESRGSDPRDAGLDTWTQLMNMIGRGSTVQKVEGNFDDLMLKEWAHQHLLSFEGGGLAGPRNRPPEGLLTIPSTTLSPYDYHMRKDPVDRVLQRAHTSNRGDEVVPGCLVRAAPAERSPFLLKDQELHKAVVLILSDDEHATVGAILNRPASKGLDIRIAHNGGESRTVTLPLRFGGQYTPKNEEPIVWLHCNSVLRASKIGQPIGYKRNGIWKCTAADVTDSIGQGLATPEDFFVVTGVAVWTKEMGGGTSGDHRGMQGEIRRGNFEVVPHSKVEDVWESLAKQNVLTDGNLQRNLDHAEEAWLLGGTPYEEYTGWADDLADSMAGYKKHDAHYVFKSHVRVSELSDEALRNWMSIFLLGKTNQ